MFFLSLPVKVCGVSGLVVNARNLQAEGNEFKSRSGGENFQTIILH